MCRGNVLGSAAIVHVVLTLTTSPFSPCCCDREEDKRHAALTCDDRRQMTEARRRAARSDALVDLAAEVSGAPEEVRTVMPGFDRCEAGKSRGSMRGWGGRRVRWEGSESTLEGGDAHGW